MIFSVSKGSIVDIFCFYRYLGYVQILNPPTFTPNLFKIKDVTEEFVEWSRIPIN